MTPKLASYLGLAQRAGGVIYGEDIIVEKRRAVKAVIVDSEMPAKNKERLLRKCGVIPVFVTENLAEALHRENVKAVGISNQELAEAVVNLFKAETIIS